METHTGAGGEAEQRAGRAPGMSAGLAHWAVTGPHPRVVGQVLLRQAGTPLEM